MPMNMQRGVMAGIIAGAMALAAGTLARAATDSNAPPKPSPAVEEAMHSMFAVHEISEAVISPDGQRVAWVESLTGKDGAPSPNSAIYVADRKAVAAPQRITAASAGAAASESDLAWSPDSKSIAFFLTLATPASRSFAS